MRQTLPPGGPGWDRRSLLLGVAGLLLAACTPVRRARPACRPPPRRAPAPRPPAAPAYRIVPRAAWGAAPLRPNHDPMDRVERITLHHTAELPGMTDRTDAELVKAVQAFHQDDRGWADIGYHFVVGRHGDVFEGRALAVQGAHAGGGSNARNLGVSVIGDYGAQLPPPRALATLERFLVDRMRIHGVPAGRVFGHRDFKATACPGDALYAWLDAFKRARTPAP